MHGHSRLEKCARASPNTIRVVKWSVDSASYLIFCPKCESGDVELTNMQLKPEALNALKLPVKVKAGFLGSVKLKVRANIFCYH